MIPNLTHIPNRTEKPRNNGLTIIQDPGYSIQALENILSTSAHIIDYVRIEPAALMSQEDLAKKVALYHDNDITPFLSGLVFEAAYIRKSLEDYRAFIKKVGIDCVEISDGLVEIKPEKKGKLITEYSHDFQVISKVGPRKNDFIFESDSWREYIETELIAGSSKIIIQGNKAGVSLSINGEQEVKAVLAHAIAKLATIDQLIWEAPHINQQLWYVNNFGANVNIANIAAQDVLNFESIRIGLHSTTLTTNLPPHLTVGNIREVDQVYNFDWQI